MLLSPQLLVRNRPAAVGFTATSTESSNFLTRATTITSNTDKTNYDAMITGMVDDTDFAKLDALYIWAAPDNTAAKLNLASSSFPVTESGTVSFSASHGYTGDGSSFFLDSGFNPNTAISPQYTLNSASLGIYVQSNITSGSTNAENMGADSVGAAYITSFLTGAAVWQVNGGGARVPASSTSQGLWIATRTSANDVAFYRNGNTTPIDSSAALASDFVPRETFKYFVRGGVFSQSQMSAAFLGSGLSSAAMARIAARLNTFHAAYSINVY